MENMGCFFAFDYFIGIIILLCLHAPWWVWLIFIAGGLFWFIVYAVSEWGGGGSDSSSDNSTLDKP